MRYITLPAVNKQIPLGIYVQGVRAAKANPSKEFKHGLTTWWPTTGAEIMRQFLASVHHRINDAVPYTRRGL